MRKESKFFSIHTIIALMIAIVGIVCIWIGGGLTFEDLASNIGSVLLVSGIYTIIDNMLLKTSLVELVIKKVGLNKDIDETGLDEIGTTLANIHYQELFKEAKANIDIVHNYARTWTTNNFDFIRNVLLNNECRLRVVLLNPRSLFVPALEKHYGYTEGQLIQLIGEAVEKWKSLYREVEEHHKLKEPHIGTVELYYFNGQPTDSLYRIDNRIVVVATKHSKSKSIYLPYTIYQNNGEKGLYSMYLKEIEKVIKDSTKINLLE